MTLRDLPTDFVFHVGVPETRSIPITLFYAPLTYPNGLSSCHDETWIRSTLPSVTIQQPCYNPPTYVCPGGGSSLVVGFDAGNSVGPGTGIPSGYDWPATLQITYDGSGTAPAAGQIEFLADVGCTDVGDPVFRKVGAINVHVEPVSFQPISIFQAYTASGTSNWYDISNSFADNRPDAIMLVTPFGGTSSSYAGLRVGVWYNGTTHRWSIYNESGAAMTSGQRFNIMFAGYQGQRVFVHQTTVANVTGNWTTLNDPRLNDNRYARVFVTHVWKPQGYAANYLDDAVGVWFSTASGRWTIYRESTAAMPVNRTFNVVVAAAPQLSSVGLWPTDEAPDCDEFHCSDDPNVLFTHVYANPLGGGTYAYFPYETTAFHGGVTTKPGTYAGAAALTYFFNRWRPLNAY